MIVDRKAPRVPLSVWVAGTGLLMSALITAVRFVVVVLAEGSRFGVVQVAMTIAIAAIAICVRLLVLLLLMRGFLIAPALVTLIAVWDLSELLTWSDWLAYVAAGIGVVCAVLVWVPPTRVYIADTRAHRRLDNSLVAGG